MQMTLPALSKLTMRAHLLVTMVRTILADLSLELNESKSVNMVLSPYYLPRGIYRRVSGARVLTTKKRQRELQELEAAIDDTILEFDPYEDIDGITAEERNQGYPYPLAENIRVLGVLLDRHMQLDAQVESLLAKAQVRQGILKKVAGSKWGLEVGILSMTHDALINSLLRYALAIMGAHLPQDLLQKIDTCITNVAARKIIGVDRTARIETLHFVAGTQTFRNMVVMHMAEYMDLVLRAHNSTIRDRVLETLKDCYKINSLEPENITIKVPVQEILKLPTNTTTERVWNNTSWSSARYPANRTDEGIKNICSMYVNYSKEMRTSMFHKEGTYQFEGTESWIDVALQILKYINWSPECSRPWEINVKKALPKREEERKIFPGMLHRDITDWHTENTYVGR